MHPRHAILRHSEHSEGVVVSQVLLGGEREFPKVVKLPEVRWMNPRRIELLAVGRHVLVDISKRARKALGLNGSDLIARRDLDRLQAEWRIGGRVELHGTSHLLQARGL